MHSPIGYNDIVIFLGAGFVHDLEFPVISNFGSASDLQYKGITADYNKHKKATPILKKAGDVFKKFQEYSSNVKKFMKIDGNNMEDVFCLADIIKGTSTGKDTIPEVDNLEIDEIIKSIRLWLWKVFQQCPPINDKKEIAKKNKCVYEDFFRFLIEKYKENENVSVITTNYDLMPEFFINEIGGKCTYNIHSQYQEWRVQDDSTNRFVCINSNGCVPIYKLHGSVNFFFGEEGEKDIINIVTDKLEVDRVGNSRAHVFKNRPSLFPLDAIVELRKRNNDKIPTPAIIPPMYSKIESMKWLKDIWNNSLIAIRNAKILVFVGYSFPQSDQFMKSFFQAAFINRKSPNPPIIMNLDKNDDMKCTYRSIFDNIDSDKFLSGTFVEKHKDLMHLIDKY